MSVTIPTLEDPAMYIQPGQSDRVMNLHKTVRGEHIVLVYVTDHAVYIRVFPTSHPGIGLVTEDNNAFWATVSWNNYSHTWSCSLTGPGYRYSDRNPEKETSHVTLKSAMRRARKHTQNRSGVPLYNLRQHLDSIPDLLSVYPTDEQIVSRRKYEDWYWNSVREQVNDEYPTDHDLIIAAADF